MHEHNKIKCGIYIHINNTSNLYKSNQNIHRKYMTLKKEKRHTNDTQVTYLLMSLANHAKIKRMNA